MERIDLQVKRGETFLQAIRFRENGDPVDLSGYRGACQVREAPDGGKLLCTMEVTVSPQQGYVELHIPSPVTAEMTSGCYVYDFWLESADGIRDFYFGGRFRVLPSVTE